MTQTRYIFIGGVYRTGTDLLRNLLNSAEDVAISGETHFLGCPRTLTLLWHNVLNHKHRAETYQNGFFGPQLASPGSRQKLAQIGDISTDRGAGQVVDYLYNYVYNIERAFWRWLPEHVERDRFLAGLLASDRTERGLFELMMSLYANGRPIHGEKTPVHLHYVPLLFEWFPEAKFIHMFRDPRGIFMSQKTKKAKQERVSPRLRLFRKSAALYEIFMSSSVIIHWLRAAQLHAHYQMCYPERYYLLKFEDLIADPDTQIRTLCDFLEINFTEKMLQHSVVNSSFVSSGQIQGFDQTVVDRWRKQLHPATNKWFVSWCQSYLIEFGYQI